VTTSSELSGRAERLGAALAGERAVTIRIDRLWELFATSSPDVAREAAKRQLLTDSLSELEQAGQLTVPKSRGSWDRTGHPPLPRFVRRIVPRAPSTAVHDRLRYPWVPALAWAASERLTTSQREALMAVSTWLARHPRPPELLPHRERSLEIFGHEKRLDELLPTPLFGPGKLTLDLLAAYIVHPPFVWRPIPGSAGSDLLVIENHNTFDSVCRALAHHVAAGAACPFRFVAYGAGNAFEASVTYTADLDPVPRRILYFGDLDTEGAAIPVRASIRAVAAGLPIVEPHLGLYRLLLAQGIPQPAASFQLVMAWFGALSPDVKRLVSSGHRLAQEWVNLGVLQADASWLDASIPS
jgi:hypothetical protein